MIAGAAVFFRGIAFLLKRPRLWHWAVWPILITAVVFAGLAFASTRWLPGLMDAYLLPPSEGWWGALYWPLLIVEWSLIVLGLLIGFYIVAKLVTAPFYGKLAQRTMSELSGAPVEAPGGIWADAVLPMLNSLRRLFWLALLLPLSLIPVVGIVVGPVVAAFFFAMEFLDYSLDTVTPALAFADRRRYAWRHGGAALGFGLVVTLALAIPVLDLVVMPFAVCAGAIFLHERPWRTVQISDEGQTAGDGRDARSRDRNAQDPPSVAGP